jgi:hydrogenase maturation factor
VAKDKLILTGGAQPGDDILLTKRIAIEATAIIAGERRQELRDLYSDQELDRLANYIYKPGISIVPEARIATTFDGIHAMHDPTEGGIATGLQELAMAADVGLEIFVDNLPYDPDCLAFCQYFQLNPLGIIASGSLLLTVDAATTPLLREKLRQAHIASSVIGQVKSADFGIQLVDARGSRPLPIFERDEITKIFD